MKSREMTKRIVLFLLFWFGNTTIFLLANFFYPDMFVLGNSYLTPSLAAISAGFGLALILSLLEPAFLLLHIHIKHNLTWALIFWIVNAELIWAMGRYAEFAGIGIVGFWVALAVGFAAKIVQWGSWTLVHRL